jgi:hypothetical protein
MKRIACGVGDVSAFIRTNTLLSGTVSGREVHAPPGVAELRLIGTHLVEGFEKLGHTALRVL